ILAVALPCGAGIMTEIPIRPHNQRGGLRQLVHGWIQHDRLYARHDSIVIDLLLKGSLPRSADCPGYAGCNVTAEVRYSLCRRQIEIIVERHRLRAVYTNIGNRDRRSPWACDNG